MEEHIFIPASLKDAGFFLRTLLRKHGRSRIRDFLMLWNSIFYLFPGLHPDGYEEADSGWPRVLRPVASRAWRLYQNGMITESEFYCSKVNWTRIDRARRMVE